MLPGGAFAQVDQSQLVRPPDAADLNSYLARLSTNPRDVAALIGAGEAALALDDPRAATGFFARADAIASGNGRIKAGLGRVMLKLQNPGEALRLFDQAARLGYPDATILADRGLARDMTGDQAGAQRDYQAALQRTPDDAELIRRYASSLGIAGQIDASDKVMQPLFYKSDRAAWRSRVFILAMNNRQAEAQKIAEQTMPPQLAAAMMPYLRKMPYLTPAQKAAAIHFGHFPAQVGTTIAAIVPTPPAPGYSQPVATKAPPPVAVAAAPTSPAQDRRTRRAEQQRQRREATRLARAETPRTATVQPTPAPTPTPTPAPTPSAAPTPQQPAPQTVQPTPAPTPAPAQVQMVQQTPGAPAPTQSAPPRQLAAATPQVQGPPAPGLESLDTPRTAAPVASQPATTVPNNATALAQASAPASTPAASPVVQPTPPAPPPQPDPQATRTLADIIRAIDVPEAERRPTVAAVDLAEIEKMQAARRAERLAAAEKVKKAAAAKAKAEADAKAKKEAEEKKRLADNPSRNWLQIATGANKSALAFTLKTLRKKYDELAPQSAWTASWGRTNRLVVGPFASFTRARTLETKLKGEGADVFAWQSDAGEVVERLSGE